MQRKKIGLETWEFGWVLTGRSQEGPILPKRWALFSKVFGLFQLFFLKKIEFDFQLLDHQGKIAG